MDSVVALAEALAWPIVVLVGLFLFRQPLTGFLANLPGKRVSKASIGPDGVSLEFFDEGITKVEESLKEDDKPVVAPTPEAISEASQTSPDHLRDLVRLSPGAAVIDAALRTEQAYRTLASEAGFDGAARAPAAELTEWLHIQGYMGTSTFEAAIKLEQIREQIVREAIELDEPRAYRYLALSTELRNRIDKAAATLN